MLFTLCRLYDQERSVPLARMLIQRSIDPLHIMLFTLCRLYDQERSVPLARMLIQRGADIEAKNGNSDTLDLSEPCHTMNGAVHTLQASTRYTSSTSPNQTSSYWKRAILWVESNPLG
jgi:hypothetical protein